jgi:hypothetical protein
MPLGQRKPSDPEEQDLGSSGATMRNKMRQVFSAWVLSVRPLDEAERRKSEAYSFVHFRGMPEAVRVSLQRQYPYTMRLIDGSEEVSRWSWPDIEKAQIELFGRVEYPHPLKAVGEGGR